METPIPGLFPVSGNVTAHVDDIIHRDRRVDQDWWVREDMPLVHRHCDTNTQINTNTYVLLVLVVLVVMKVIVVH